MKIPYKQIKTPSEKAAFYLGYMWSGLVTAGSLDPHKDAFIEGKESIPPYEDYRALFTKMANIVHVDNDHIGVYRYEKIFKDALTEAAQNLLNAEKENFGVTQAACFALGQATFDIARGEFITSSEAENRWGLKRGTVKASCGRGQLAELIPLHLVRKSGGTWIVTTTAMQAVYGQERDVKIMNKLTKLIGQQMTAADLDEEVARITGRGQAFDKIVWTDAREQSGLAYERREGETDGAYNVQFEVVKDGTDERTAVVKVVDVDIL